MKIAVTGKGGVGKTTFAATLARLYAAEGRPVLAADVDPDANLGLALGFDEETLDSITTRSASWPLPEMSATLLSTICSKSYAAIRSNPARGKPLSLSFLMSSADRALP